MQIKANVNFKVNKPTILDFCSSVSLTLVVFWKSPGEQNYFQDYSMSVGECVADFSPTATPTDHRTSRGSACLKYSLSA